MSTNHSTLEMDTKLLKDSQPNYQNRENLIDLHIKPPTQSKSSSRKLDLTFCKRLLRLLVICISKFCSWQFFSIILLLASCIGELLIYYKVGRIPGELSGALVETLHDPKVGAKPYVTILLFAIIWISIATIIKTFRVFTEESLVNSWRDKLTTNFQNRYLKNNIYYNMLLLDKTIDNT